MHAIMGHVSNGGIVQKCSQRHLYVTNMSIPWSFVEFVKIIFLLHPFIILLLNITECHPLHSRFWGWSCTQRHIEFAIQTTIHPIVLKVCNTYVHLFFEPHGRTPCFLSLIDDNDLFTKLP
jgi:hypothetical protein